LSKKDQHKIDDRRRWQLGFSNQSRLAILQSDQQTVVQQVADTLRLVEKSERKFGCDQSVGIALEKTTRVSMGRD